MRAQATAQKPTAAAYHTGITTSSQLSGIILPKVHVKTSCSASSQDPRRSRNELTTLRLHCITTDRMDSRGQACASKCGGSEQVSRNGRWWTFTWFAIPPSAGGGGGPIDESSVGQLGIRMLCHHRRRRRRLMDRR